MGVERGGEEREVEGWREGRGWRRRWGGEEDGGGGGESVDVEVIQDIMN